MDRLAGRTLPTRLLVIGAITLVAATRDARAQERRPSEPIPLGGGVENEPAPPALPGVEQDGPALPDAEGAGPVLPWLIDLHGIYGVTVAGYNRIDGLVPAWGLDLEPVDPARTPALGARYGRSTARSRAHWNAWIEQRLPFAGEFRLRLEHFQRTATFDDWRITQRENDLATFLAGSDLMDWWREKGLRVVLLGETVDGRLAGSVALLDASQRSERNRSPFVLFGGDEDFRDNPEIEEGDLRSITVGGRLDTRDVQSPLLPAPGWRVEVEFEGAGGPLGADVDFVRGLVDVRRYTRFGTDVWWDARLVWMAPLDGDGVPPQRKASLGGPGSLRGFPAARFVGDEALQISTEARFPLPLFRPLDALFLSWHVVGFGDAGAVDDYDVWHADLGAGVSGINLFSYVGLFVAQRVTDTGEPDDGPRFLVRLRRDF
ncbi:MAG TPA: BamA/TamA family outer membrane protein [Gemmatimonadota bacterium]|nr:BamA/TamA family outer membrane protein [Gemmatimonadota bacterium]